MDFIVIAPVAALTVGLCEVFKRTAKALSEKALLILTAFTPIIALTISIASILIISGVSVASFFNGVATGLSAIGLYSGAINTIENLKEASKLTTVEK